MKRVFFDMDGTMAEWKDASLEELYQRNYFKSLQPTEVASYANALARDRKADIYALSSYFTDSNALSEKKSWCDFHVPDIDGFHRLFVPYGVSKSAFIAEVFRRSLTSEDVLVDDYTANLLQWKEEGGRAIKWLNGINGNGGQFDGIRVDNIPMLEKEIFK